MVDFPADLLDRPATDAAGLVALRYLDDAATAATRLSDRTDAEALHDFRVAVRRLRVMLRAYGLREGVPKKLRRRMRKLTRATNAVRDTEAEIAWFRDRSAQFTPSQRAGLSTLRARLRARRRHAQAHTQLELQHRFATLEGKIRHAITTLRSEASINQATFRSIAAATLVQYATDLRKRLEDTGATSLVALHATRISAKRLRYLLESVQRHVTNGARLIDRLKQLQDLLGGLTDAHQLRAELQRSAEKDHRAAITAATSLLQTEVDGVLATLRADWPTAGFELEKDVTAAARQLHPIAVPPSKRPRPVRRRSRGGAELIRPRAPSAPTSP